MLVVKPQFVSFELVPVAVQVFILSLLSVRKCTRVGTGQKPGCVIVGEGARGQIYSSKPGL